MVARYGGEEFAVVLAETSAADARRLAARFLQAVRALNVTHGSHALRVTASVGVAELTEAEAGAELLARADRALYRAKSSGRDRVIESVPTSPSGAVSLDQAEIAKHKKAS
jgi:diguanylate cyclase (GGDEF)-like protein